MPLSEHEQRMLDEIETALYAEDPKFASSVRKTAAFGGRRPGVLVTALVVVGLALLGVGMVPALIVGGIPVVSFLGFLVLFGAGVLALRGRSGGVARTRGAKGAAPSDVRPQRAKGESYTSRMEDRFRRRFDQ